MNSKTQWPALLICLTCLYLLGFAIFHSSDAGLSETSSPDEPSFIARVSATTGSMTDHGSGVLVQEDLILTCAHVVRGGGVIRVSVGGGAYRDGEVIRRDAIHDLALIRIPVVLNTPIDPGRKARRGDVVTICGYPLAGEYQEATGRVVGFASHARKSLVNTVTRVDTRSEGGVSGGPVLNTERQLVGILFGSLAYSNFTDIDTVRKFLGDLD